MPYQGRHPTAFGFPPLIPFGNSAGSFGFGLRMPFPRPTAAPFGMPGRMGFPMPPPRWIGPPPNWRVGNPPPDVIVQGGYDPRRSTGGY